MKRKKTIEEGLFVGYWDDGLTDLLVGGALMTAALGWYWLGPVAMVHLPIWLTLWAPLRGGLVEPHAGYVRFTLERRRRNQRNLGLVLTLGLGLLLLLLSGVWWLVDSGLSGGILEEGVRGLPAGILSLMLFLAALLIGLPRFGLYAGWMLVAALLVILMKNDPPLSFLGGALAPLAGGLLLWIRFRRGWQRYGEGSST